MIIVDSLDFIAGAITVIVWLRKDIVPLPIKVTTLPPEKEVEPYNEWSKMVEPHVRKLTVAGAFGLNFTFNPVGAAAMAKMVKEMGETLDFAVTNHMLKPNERLTTKR